MLLIFQKFIEKGYYERHLNKTRALYRSRHDVLLSTLKEMTKTQIFFKIILLQVIKRIIPPMSNEVITLTKDTALARIIGLAEIIMCAERFTKQGLIWPLFSTAVFFLVFNGILTLLFGWIEKKMDYFRV